MIGRTRGIRVPVSAAVLGYCLATTAQAQLQATLQDFFLAGTQPSTLVQPMLKRFFDRKVALDFHRDLLETFDQALKIPEPVKKEEHKKPADAGAASAKPADRPAPGAKTGPPEAPSAPAHA